MKFALTLIAAAALAACSDRPADETNDVANAEVDVDVLPPDESVATPTNDLATGVIDTPPPENAIAPNPKTAIPAALHGRWGLTREDCTAERGEAKGLVTIAADSISFYESIARPADIAEWTPTRIRGEFEFAGEGMTWSSPMIWSAEGNRLVRTDSEGDSRLVYTRC